MGGTVMKLLIVVDMQNDFIDGALGTKEAVGIVDKVKDKIFEYKCNHNPIIFTRDTSHFIVRIGISCITNRSIIFIFILNSPF